MVPSTGTTLTGVFLWNSDIRDIIGLTIKQLLDIVFQNLMLFSNIVPCNSLYFCVDLVQYSKYSVSTVSTDQGCHRVGRKMFPDFSLTFPWLPTQILVIVVISILWWFLQYITNHIEITLFVNRCFNIVVLKIGQHKRTFSTSRKLSISCAEFYAKHGNK